VAEATQFKYRAFLSYSHRDKAWGKWLHAALEGYRIDKDLVGPETPVGSVPKTLRPIFRDREDFSAGHSLTAQTLAALEAAKFLIVICSPNAAQSKYVNEEIRHFKARGGAEHVIPVIVDGEPGASEHECFPPARDTNSARVERLPTPPRSRLLLTRAHKAIARKSPSRRWWRGSFTGMDFCPIFAP
jgi:TIR domain